MRIGLLDALLPLAALLAGCTTQPFCEALGKCGGNFQGNKNLPGGVGTEWAAQIDDACIDQIPVAPSPPSLSLIPARPAGVRAVEPSTTEWCAGLVIQNDGTVKAFDDGWYETLKQYRGWFPSVPLATARLEILDAPKQYTLEAKQRVAQHYELSPTCLHAQGVNLSCDDFNTELTKYIQESLDNLMTVEGLVYGSRCVATPEKGCNCDYNLELTTVTSGPWVTETSTPGEITFFDSEAAPPSLADFCSSGGGLQLSGTNTTDLFNRGSLKTLKLSPTSCSDLVQSKSTGETGVDCGGACPACPP